MIITSLNGFKWIKSSTVALLIEETESQIKSNVGFWWEEKTGVPGEKPLRTE